MRDHGGDWAGILPGQRTELLDFSANISPLGMPAGALDAAVKAICEADRYPDPQCRALRKKLSHVHGIAEEKIVCGNGAADLIWRICRCLQPAKAFVPVPTFTEYEAALDAVNEVDEVERYEAAEHAQQHHKRDARGEERLTL